MLYFKLLIHERGFASFYSSGDIQKWTHDTVIEKLNLQASKRILHSSNLMAGVIGFDFTNEKAKELLNDWNYLSSKKDFIYHAGTKIVKDELRSNGGRVLNVTSVGKNFSKIRKKILSNIRRLKWNYGFYRRDIGWKVINKNENN